MHCTGQTSTQARSFTSMHASVMIASPATANSLPVAQRSNPLLPASGQSLQGLVEREEADWAAGELGPDLLVRVAEELAADGARRHDGFHQGGHVLAVQDQRVGVTEPFEDDRLGLVVVEVRVVLQRADIFGTHDLETFGGKTLELLD